MIPTRVTQFKTFFEFVCSHQFFCVILFKKWTMQSFKRIFCYLEEHIAFWFTTRLFYFSISSSNLVVNRVTAGTSKNAFTELKLSISHFSNISTKKMDSTKQKLMVARKIVKTLHPNILYKIWHYRVQTGVLI